MILRVNSWSGVDNGERKEMCPLNTKMNMENIVVWKNKNRDKFCNVKKAKKNATIRRNVEKKNVLRQYRGKGDIKFKELKRMNIDAMKKSCEINEKRYPSRSILYY